VQIAGSYSRGSRKTGLLKAQLSWSWCFIKGYEMECDLVSISRDLRETIIRTAFACRQAALSTTNTRCFLPVKQIGTANWN